MRQRIESGLADFSDRGWRAEAHHERAHGVRILVAHGAAQVWGRESPVSARRAAVALPVVAVRPSPVLLRMVPAPAFAAAVRVGVHCGRPIVAAWSVNSRQLARLGRPQKCDKNDCSDYCDTDRLEGNVEFLSLGFT